MADAMVDPIARGLSLGNAIDTSSPAEQIEPEQNGQEDDPFEGEVPVMQSSSIKPVRRESDQSKIIALDQHRAD